MQRIKCDSCLQVVDADLSDPDDHGCDYYADNPDEVSTGDYNY